MIKSVDEFITTTTESVKAIPDELRNEIGDEIRKDNMDKEYDSWVNSYPELSKVLQKAKMPNGLQIILEYNFRRTPFRCDALIAGQKNGRDKLLIIELKQWEQGKVCYRDRTHVIAYGKKKEHPAWQVHEYENLFKNAYVDVKKKNIEVASCVFVHNYAFEKDLSNDPLIKGYEEYAFDENGKTIMYGLNDYNALCAFLHDAFDKSSDTVIKTLDNSEIDLKAFIDNIGNLIEGNPIFPPTDEQDAVMGKIIENLYLNDDQNKHHVFVVKGGPGTGKTVLAFNLLVKLGATKEHDGMELQNVIYATKNKYLRESYLTVLKKIGKDEDDKLEAYNNRTLSMLFFPVRSVLNSDDNTYYDCIIVDETQRMEQWFPIDKEKKQWKRDGLISIIKKSKNTVFLMDDEQKLAFNDILFSDQIKDVMKDATICVYPDLNDEDAVKEYTLFQAFRTFGSTEHLNWIDRFLGYEKAQKAKCKRAKGYTFRVVATPDDLFYMVNDKVKNGKRARVSAGLCWQWKEESKTYNTKADIVIEGANPSERYYYSWHRDGINDWSVSPDTISEVGCAHNVLGQEFDYAGVIIGPDLVFDGKRVLPDPDKNTQFMTYLKGNEEIRINGNPISAKNRRTVSPLSKSKDKDRFDEAKDLIRNHYRILLTRGREGCYVYCVDPGLRSYLCKQLGGEEPISYKPVGKLPECEWEDDPKPGDENTAEVVAIQIQKNNKERLVGKISMVYKKENNNDTAQITANEKTYGVSAANYKSAGRPAVNSDVSFVVWTNSEGKMYANDIRLVTK